jgi:Protein of unknown function (DUF3052)
MTLDHGLPPRLAIRPGQVIVEIGRRWDCDESLREEVLAAPARVLADEDYEGIADVVLLWWRAGDGNLFDALTDASSPAPGKGRSGCSPRTRTRTGTWRPATSPTGLPSRACP